MVHEVAAHLERLVAHRYQLEARVVQERASVAALRDALQKLELDSRASNLEVDELDARIRSYQERLDKGIISFKEMEDLRTKIASEKLRMNRLAQAQADLAPREQHLRAQVADTAREIEETEKGRLADLRNERAALAAAAPPYALAQYEALRATFSNPIAPIDHGTCGGCKIRVSANTVERVRAGREIVTCEHCSRILFSL
ncbi:MAG: C4-type zinc ribbon domain-containing protein [Candidatus Bipolaricaulota bacterium]|nr:C4-type zinc ribbon domain-containing protein [Candidatus Bipolaricaulota bacterium]